MEAVERRDAEGAENEGGEWGERSPLQPPMVVRRSWTPPTGGSGRSPRCTENLAHFKLHKSLW